jgi:hypothetical protein
MKPYEWNKDKDEYLKASRGIGFNDIVEAISAGYLVDTVAHHNRKKYPGQKIYIIVINKYCWAVPFIESGEKIFLKTIYPSRLATKKYLKGE